MKREHKLPQGFERPTELPSLLEQPSWQEQNRSWWDSNPMRYDWNGQLQAAVFSREYFEEIDRRFFSDAARYMPSRTLPFEELIPYEELADLDVLEIGVGSGSHAQLLAPRSKSYKGIDLTDFATRSTQRRFEEFGIQGEVVRMDAEKMNFADASFDWIWTWGVIHHSANTKQVLSEMKRVLRPGGRAVVMVYHRSFLYYYVTTALLRGVLRGGFLKAKSLHELVQTNTDGAIARFYSQKEWSELVAGEGFGVDRLLVKGQKSEVVPIPASRVKDAVMSWIPNSLSRFVLNSCKQGSFLISQLRRP